MRQILFNLLASVALIGGVMVLPAALASAATTDGSWIQYPSGATVYQADVQAPINSNGTSNWPAKSKGGFPIMFKLSSGIGPAVFESIGSDGYEGYLAGNFANDAAYESFHPTSLTFNDITTLKTDYTFTNGDCHGGSLRWSVRTSPSQTLFIYYGGAPSFTDCTTGVNNQSGINMIGFSDLRYDTTQYGGTFYDTYENAKALMGSLPLTAVSLVIDSGWQGLSTATDQILTVSNTTVNDNVYQWDAGGTGGLAPTCTLPDATLKVTKLTGSETGDVNEIAVVQNFDSGNAFRVVDCKYQYVLAIQTLRGPGGYLIEIQIGGVTVGTAHFDLK